MLADLEGVILGVDAEGIVAQGLENGVPLKPLESSIDVIAREREQVAHVQPFRRWVREHHERVERARAFGEVGVMRTTFAPPVLPFGFDRCGIVRDWSAHGSGVVRVGCSHVSGCGRQAIDLVDARPTSEGFDLSEFSEGGKLNKPDIALPP
jgi:hypothetical protein